MKVHVVIVQHMFGWDLADYDITDLEQVKVFTDAADGIDWIKRDALSKHFTYMRNYAEIDEDDNPVAVFDYWFDDTGKNDKRTYSMHIKEVE